MSFTPLLLPLSKIIMSLFAPRDCNRLHGGCGECGRHVPPKEGLRRCKGCSLIVYCSRKCERAHWSCHKKKCKKTNTTSGGTIVSAKDKRKQHQPVVPNKSVQKLNANLFRSVIVEEPDPSKVKYHCWCCAKMLPAAGDNTSIGAPKSDYQRSDGPFMGSTFGRVPGAHGNKQFIEGESYPSALVKADLVQTFGDDTCTAAVAAICLSCFVALQNDASKHLKQCEDWLGARTCPDVATLLTTEPTLAEMRTMSLVTLEMNPDLSRGPHSVGGYITVGKGHEQRFVPILYSNPRFEAKAFPALFLTGKGGFDGTTADELIMYTMMRLYSPDDTYRRNQDYVAFSMLRMAAFDAYPKDKIFATLPPAVPFGPCDVTALRLRPVFE